MGVELELLREAVSGACCVPALSPGPSCLSELAFLTHRFPSACPWPLLLGAPGAGESMNWLPAAEESGLRPGYSRV